MAEPGTSLPRPGLTLKTGKEPFLGAAGVYVLQDFWAWAYSDLAGNTLRGKLAEYIVATAVGCEKEIRCTWASIDLCTSEGIKIQVKSSAYLQSWPKKGFSQIVFGIAESVSQDGAAQAAEKKRQADVYVFCVHKHKDRTTLNPLDLSQWDFYPVATRRLDACFKGQQTLSRSTRCARAAKWLPAPTPA